MATMSPGEIGELIRSVRKTHGLTQAELAEEIAGRKTLALFGRAAPRDFIDVFNLARRFGKPKLLELATERDLGFDRRVFRSDGSLGESDQRQAVPAR
ncbi:hypothetical protein ACIRON_15975 [Nocardioides sp. NPDC101246]|uniref:hypothetical protein n=1 Tax=Nocardioides sp. NPDC101246 TaxID=3364336 RepID=UPI0037F501ED